MLTGVVFLAFLGHAMADLVSVRTAPTVILDNATVTGVFSGSTNQFLGIPFAQPPTGNMRFQVPQALPPYNTSFSATALSAWCPQQMVSRPPLPPHISSECRFIPWFKRTVYSAPDHLMIPSEDCLTLNVITPSAATPASRLPVLVSIFGGGFEAGGSDIAIGSTLVRKSILFDIPVIYVSMNYRVTAFGFLASQEVKDAGVGNLGLRDQRLALRWIKQYISAFGGDPAKVTIWGESAGGISVTLQMLTNKGDTEGLFRAAFMESGPPISVGDITKGQKYYDALVQETGCSGKKDTLQCLREVPYEKLLSAVDQSPSITSYQSLVLAWLPRVDGDFVEANPLELVQEGPIANVPFVSGNCDDEGTAFSFPSINITTNTEFEEYIRSIWLSDASHTEIAGLMRYYPQDPTQGSPFNTGHRSSITPQFKRIAAFLGDAFFQGPRRLFIQKRSKKQKVWTFVNRRFKDTPCLGSYHSSDVNIVASGGDLALYIIRFVANLDPNDVDGEDLYWPSYLYNDATANQTMLELLDDEYGMPTQALTTDTYRTGAMGYLTELVLEYPI